MTLPVTSLSFKEAICGHNSCLAALASVLLTNLMPHALSQSGKTDDQAIYT